jgi:hypothetical protein
MQENTATKNEAIGAAILAAMARGLTLPQAFDAVLGAGAYVAMAGELHDALRAQAAQ